MRLDESFQIFDRNKSSVDSNVMWEDLEKRIAAETRERPRRILELVLAHVKAEASKDLDGVLNTLVERPVYRFFNYDDNPDLNPGSTRDEIATFYDKLVFTPDAFRIEMKMEIIIVDDDGALTEGPGYWAYPGTTLRDQMGMADADPDEFYIRAHRVAIIWPYDADQDRLVGELVYHSSEGFENILDRKITGGITGPA